MGSLAGVDECRNLRVYPMGGRALSDRYGVETLRKLEDRSYKNYKRRMQASQRLASRDKAWNTSLLSLTFATTVASIGLLTNGAMYGAAGPTVLVGLAVFSLVISLVVSSLNYGARSRDLFNNYRRFQRLSVDVEHLNTSGEEKSSTEIQVLLDRFNDLLDESENHTDADHLRAEGHKYSLDLMKDWLLSALPYATLVIPLLVLAPFVGWIVRAT